MVILMPSFQIKDDKRSRVMDMSSGSDGFFGVTPIGQVLSLRSNQGQPLESWNEIIWERGL